MKNMSQLHQSLQRMVSVLNSERQALAALDIDAVMACALDKQGLCVGLEQFGSAELDEESISLLESARQINEVNRRIRNLAAANIAARIDAIRGSPALYSITNAQRARLAQSV